MMDNRRKGTRCLQIFQTRISSHSLTMHFREDRENFARYPKWGKCYPCKFLFPPFRVSELLCGNIVIWSYPSILAKTQKKAEREREKRATRDRNERKRKDRRTVLSRHDLRWKGPGVSLRTYFNARTLSRIGSAGICLPNEKFCCLTSLAVFVLWSSTRRSRSRAICRLGKHKTAKRTRVIVLLSGKPSSSLGKLRSARVWHSISRLFLQYLL